MRLLVGTSGYSYAPWKGSFYPAKLPAAKMLTHYSAQLPTVEINNTFYRLPKADAFTKWASEVPDGFMFAVKGSKRITHDKRLQDVDDAVRLLVDTSSALGPKLGPVLFQLPPNLRKDLPRLQAFLQLLRGIAPELKAAFEFRHASWFEDDVFGALADARAALCVAEDEKLETPMRATTSWGYLRLRRQDYDDVAVAAWTDRVLAQPWGEAYVFFKHEDEGIGPKLAANMLARVQPQTNNLTAT